MIRLKTHGGFKTIKKLKNILPNERLRLRVLNEMKFTMAHNQCKLTVNDAICYLNI